MNKGIQSVQRAAAILEYVALQGGAGISELSRELQLNKSTVFSLVKTLEGLGFVFKNEHTDNYQATYRLRTLADASQDPRSIIGFARPILEKLQQKYDETIHFVRSQDHVVVYLDKLESSKSIRIHSGVGSTMPLHCTGVGKAILAWQSDADVEDYIKDTGLPAMTSHSIRKPDVLREELRRVRAQGFSIDNEENQDDLYCVGMPIFGRDQEVRYAISLSIPKYRKDEIDLSAAVQDLRETASEISKFF